MSVCTYAKIDPSETNSDTTVLIYVMGYNGERIGQGKDNVRKFIEGNPALLSELDARIRASKDQIADTIEEFELDEDDDDFDIRTMDEDI